MKNLKLIAILLLIIFSITACSSKENSGSKKKKEAEILRVDQGDHTEVIVADEDGIETFHIELESTTVPDLMEGDYTYVELEDGTVKITGYSGNGGEKKEFYNRLDIPEKIADKDVTVIGSEAFAKSTVLEEVYLPRTIKTIEAKAFYGSSIARLLATTCSALTEIGSEAFAECANLAYADIYGGEMKIAAKAFANDDAFRYFVVRHDMTLTADIFEGCEYFGTEIFEFQYMSSEKFENIEKFAKDTGCTCKFFEF